MLRVAAASLKVAEEGAALHECLAAIEQAAAHAAQLVVLPDLTVLIGHEQPDLNGPFLRPVREAARRHGIHVALGIALQEPELGLTASALLFDDEGELIGRSDGQLIGEGQGLVAGRNLPKVVDTALGRVGLCAGADALSMEQVRALALAGAQLVCLLLGRSEGRQHRARAAARAADNEISIIVAHVRGESDQEGASGVFVADGTPAEPTVEHEVLTIGQTVLAPLDQERRLLQSRRPDAYRPVLGKLRIPETPDTRRSLDVVVLSNVDCSSIEQALELVMSSVRELAAEERSLIVLPERFCFRDPDPEQETDWFATIVRQLAEACRTSPTLVVTSLLEQTGQGLLHNGLVIGHAGIVARSPQVHVPHRLAGVQAGRRFEVLPLPWGKTGLLIAEDLLYPESTRSLRLLGADLIVALGREGTASSGLQLEAAAADNGVSVAAAFLDQSLLVDGLSSEAWYGAEGTSRGRLDLAGKYDQLVLRPHHCLGALVSRPSTSEQGSQRQSQL